MAIDKRLKIYDDQGHDVDYDIMADDVKFLPDGKDLPTKLAEMEEEIGEGGYTPPAGGIPKTDLAPSVQTSLGLADTALQAADKTQLQGTITQLQNALNALIGGNVQGAIDTFNEVVDFLNGIDTSDPTLFNQLKSLSDAITALQTSLAGKISGIKTSDNTPLTPDSNGIVTLPPAGSTIYPATAAPSMDGTAAVGSSAKYAREDHVHPHDTSKQDTITDLATIRSGASAGATALQPADVSVETPATPDGTFELNVGNDTYTVNLNHTHENMAKIVKCTEATKPATLDNDTIYVQVDNATTPTEIECLYLFGLEFSGGGVPDTGQPLISRPADGTTISLGKNMGSGVSKNITIKGKNLTGDLTVTVGTGLSLTYGQSTGSSVTIPLADALLGAQVTVAYNTFGGLTDGSLIISHGNDVLSAVTVVVEALLPSAYTQLEYISNCVRGIDTGILATDSEDLTTSVAGSSWEVDVRYDSSLPSANQMVVVGNEDVGHWGGYINAAQKFGLGNNDAFSAAATVRQVITFTFWSNKITATSNGQTFSKNYTYHNHRNVCLFRNVNPGNQQYAGRQYTGRIYSAKCTSGGSFNGIPAKRNSDNHFGLYDIENNVFYDLSVAS